MVATPEVRNGTTNNAQAQRDYLHALASGTTPLHRPFFDPDLENTIRIIENLAAKGNTKAVENTLKSLAQNGNALADLLNNEPHLEIVDNSTIPPLPEHATFSPDVSKDGCKWLDEMVTFSKQWSPKTYSSFHTGIALWTLSGIAARRVYLAFGPGGEYTPFFIALVADTGKFAKTTCTKIYKSLMREIGLDYLMCADTITPQKLISNMAGISKLPRNAHEWDILPEEKKEKKLRDYAMSGQKVWYYDEFGQQLDEMTAKGGVMSGFKGILRRLDDCEIEASNDTHARNEEIIDMPYMALCANLTVVDIKPYAGKDAKFWRDGFFARFGLITVPQGTKRTQNVRYPQNEMIFPSSITSPLLEWHKRLGIPQAYATAITDDSDNVTGYEFSRDPLPRNDCAMTSEVTNAFYAYLNALEDIIDDYNLTTLAGNYIRLPKAALRMAMLFASLENYGRIELRHWAKAQEIAEEWRYSLHELYSQVNSDDTVSDAMQIEEDLLRMIKKLTEKREAPTIREISQNFKHYDTDTLRGKIKSLTLAGILEEIKQGKTSRFKVILEKV